MSLTMKLACEEGCTVLSFDRINVSNSMYHHYILPALAEIVPPLGRHAINTYDREPPKLVYIVGGGGKTTAIRSARGRV